MTNLNDGYADLEAIIRSKLPTAKPDEFVKYGFKKGRQIYLHKPTGKRFIANEALPGRRVPPYIVGDAIGLFYDGLSYRDIQRRIDERHGFKPSTATLYEWVRDYVRRGRQFLSGLKARTGDTWAADEMMTRIDGKQIWVWSVMDTKTRYLLATHISTTRTIPDAVTLFSKAAERAATTPKRIITDRMRAYIDGIERVFGADTHHAQTAGIRESEINNNIAERLHGTIRERTKVMRGMETKSTAELVMDGFMLHYNHMRPHHALKGKTPAEAAQLPVVFHDWIEVAHLQDATFQKREEFKEHVLKRRPFRDKAFRTRRF